MTGSPKAASFTGLPTGEPTGIFIDGAMEYIEKTVPETSPELIDAALDIATSTLVSLGLTGVHDPVSIARSLNCINEKSRKALFH